MNALLHCDSPGLQGLGGEGRGFKLSPSRGHFLLRNKMTRAIAKGITKLREASDLQTSGLSPQLLARKEGTYIWLYSYISFYSHKGKSISVFHLNFLHLTLFSRESSWCQPHHALEMRHRLEGRMDMMLRDKYLESIQGPWSQNHHSAECHHVSSI